MFINLLVSLYGMSQLFVDIHTSLPERIGEIVHVDALGIADRTQRIVASQAKTKELWDAVKAVYVQLLDRRAITN